MVFDKMATICPDFKWFVIPDFRSHSKPSHLKPNLLSRFQIPTCELPFQWKGRGSEQSQICVTSLSLTSIDILSQIDLQPDPNSMGTRRKDGDVEMESERVLARADPEKQESLMSENDPDPMEGEQTW